MKARTLVVLAVFTVVAAAFVPGRADDVPQLTHVQNAVNRIPPGSPGEERHVTLLFGPYMIPPGQDMNRVTIDVPLQTGFYTSVFPNLYDARTGEEPTEQEAHIHHAHWFRVTQGNEYEYYEAINGMGGLSWVFGTGEERTGGTLKDREATGEGWRYGIFLDGSTTQLLIFMIHNKSSAPLNAYITLDIDMVYGSREQIAGAAPFKDIHPLRGILTGTTQDAIAGKTFGARSVNGVLSQDYTVDFDGGTLIASASHMHPGGKWVYVTNLGPKIQVSDGIDPETNEETFHSEFLCAQGGTNGSKPADLDGDGVPGTTLFVSKKFDQVPETWPYSEDYQMGGTQGGFRAPFHRGDIIRQYGVYDVNRSSAGAMPSALFREDPYDLSSPIKMGTLDTLPHAWYAAMSYTGMYVDDDVAARPAHATGLTDVGDCVAASFASSMRADTNGGFVFDVSNPRKTYITHGWLHVDAVCNAPDDTRGGGVFPCENHTPASYVDGQIVDTIHTANFKYVPGDLAVRNPVDQTVTVPLVKKGTTLRLMNEDLAGGIRHTFTSCLSPCQGSYVANYPVPDGRFDSGKLGNLDYIDGGLVNLCVFTGDCEPQFTDSPPYFNGIAYDTLPYRDMFISSDFQSGEYYNYFCSIHPTMRGVFKVVD